MSNRGLLRFQNTLTTNFQKTSLTWEIDYYSYKKLPDKNSGLKNLEKSGRVATLLISMKIALKKKMCTARRSPNENSTNVSKYRAGSVCVSSVESNSKEHLIDVTEKSFENEHEKINTKNECVKKREKIKKIADSNIETG